MKMIKRFDPGTEFFTGERCYIVELHNDSSDPGCSIARARVEPGVTTQLHSLQGTAERYAIVGGQGEVEVDGNDPSPVGPMDVIHIPAGVSQRITNTGENDLIFLCVCTPGFQPGCYTNLEPSDADTNR